MKFNLRDIFWATLVVALALALALEYLSKSQSLAQRDSAYWKLQSELIKQQNRSNMLKTILDEKVGSEATAWLDDPPIVANPVK